MLGGTGYIGPRYVRAAVERGHNVTIFNRGKGHADLPEMVERLVGDREGDLQAIQNRDWDEVVDLGTFRPAWVRSVGEALKDRVKHYTFISLAVYDDSTGSDKTTEESPILEYQGNADPYSVTTLTARHDYGALKVLCEREAERQFPHNNLYCGWVTSQVRATPTEPSSIGLYGWREAVKCWQRGTLRRPSS
jgi:2'-hydroxyisoflavone reductase